MRRTEVGSVWGVGHKTTARLAEGGIRTVLELRGTSCFDVDDAPAPNQQIMCSRSFGELATELAAVTEIVSGFASRVAEKLRVQQSVAGAVRVFITTSPFRRKDAQHSPSITMPVRPTSDTRVLIAAAVRGLEGMYRPGFNYVKAGVMLVDLGSQAQPQGELDLFTTASEPSGDETRGATVRLMTAVDALNQRFGLGAVAVASTVQQGQAVRYASKQER